ncbi:MAG: delta-class carbonic anhydrase [Vibrio sp.]|uniref:delta-class carbonic anhydrase n=1 Tax=Vibrio TaxID=662 RepID=UPI0023F74E72|nr:delta-class carbonic anhydrase [Vibrio sp. VCS]
MKSKFLVTFTALITTSAMANVDDNIIHSQRIALEKNTIGLGFGPQSPRDIDNLTGKNSRNFSIAPEYHKMNLCNIHFHKNAEHKGGEFTKYAGNGNGKGYGTGYKYNGNLTATELKPFKNNFGIQSGDTIEVHYVHSTAQVEPGATLNSCLSPSIANPQLRVEAQVYVLVNDKKASNFVQLNEVGIKNGYYQALNIPDTTGTPIIYAGSTTGPSYNEQGSPLQVTWSVRPNVIKVNIESVEKWLKNNPFDEDHAHGVRNLVTNPELLSSAH